MITQQFHEPWFYELQPIHALPTADLMSRTARLPACV